MEGESRVGMKYANGVTCWNGPARSTKVVLSCGAEDRLLSASEPGRCEYQFEFETPSFCKEDPAQMGGTALPYQRDEL